MTDPTPAPAPAAVKPSLDARVEAFLEAHKHTVEILALIAVSVLFGACFL